MIARDDTPCWPETTTKSFNRTSANSFSALAFSRERSSVRWQAVTAERSPPADVLGGHETAGRHTLLRHLGQPDAVGPVLGRPRSAFTCFAFTSSPEKP